MRRWLFTCGLLAWAFLFYLLGSYRSTMMLVAFAALFEAWRWSRMLHRSVVKE